MSSEFLNDRLAQDFLSADASGHRVCALEVSTAATRLFPSSIFWARLHADNLRQIGRSRDAKEQLLALVDHSGGLRFWVQISLGKACESLGQFDEAEHWFRMSTETEPSDTAPWIFLGGFLSRVQRFDEALHALKSGLKATGDLDEVWLNLGLVNRALGRLAQAEKCFLEALAICPDYVGAALSLEDIRSATKMRQKWAELG